MHKESLVLLADPVYGWEQQKAWIWQDDAACGFQPPTMFEIANPGDPIADDLSVNEVKDLNAANMEAAKKVCDSCPVWHLCYSASTENDSLWTMRAGILPTGYNETPQGRPRNEDSKPAIKRDKPCAEGHDDWKQYKGDGHWYCAPCKVEANRLYRAGKAKPKTGPVVFERGHKCSMGHDNWVQNGKYFRCRTCKNEATVEFRRKKREAAKLGS